jgi:lipid-A-disaccharide synthase
MKPLSIMIVAGEPSGDLLAAELVAAIRDRWAKRPFVYSADTQPLLTTLEPSFFGAGGPKMREAGVRLYVDMMQHSVIGLSDVLRKAFHFAWLLRRLSRLAADLTPDVLVCVDFSGFNRRLGHRVRKASKRRSWFHNWNPKIVQYVSPQVWASREGRAALMARDFDLLLSIFPFEKAWYEARTPGFRVEFVGHPMVDRYAALRSGPRADGCTASGNLLLLPGSRQGELARHLPPMMDAVELLRATIPELNAVMVLPNDTLMEQARAAVGTRNVRLQSGDLPSALRDARVAIASTGTVTMECAYFGVPTVALYKTSWMTYQVAKRIVTVKFLAMPNLLANEAIFPEFIQDAVTGDNLAAAALTLWRNESRRAYVRAALARIIASLGGPGASDRAAAAILSLVNTD